MSKTNHDSNFEPVDCFKCRHFFVTWDNAKPKGCRAFGFKTQKLPSAVVYETSGEPCMRFEPKQDDSPATSSKKSNNGGWIA